MYTEELEAAIAHQQQLEQMQQEEEFMQMTTSHTLYDHIDIEVLKGTDGDVIIWLGIGGFRTTLTLNKADAHKLAHILTVVA